MSLPLHPQQRQAYYAFLIWYGASNIIFTLITTVNLIYQFTIAHLSPLQMVLVGSCVELTIIIAQLPTGVIADVFSRRRAMIIGTFLVGLGFVVEGFFPTIEIIMLAQVIWGIGSTLLDGADAAWLADEVGEEHLERVYVRASQLAQAGTLVAIPASIFLGSLSLSVPVVLGGMLMMALAATMPFFVPERAFTPPARGNRTTWAVMAHTLRQGVAIVRVSPVLLALMGIELCFGLASEGWDRFWQLFLLTHFDLPRIGTSQPILWIGLAGMVSAILGIGLNQIIARQLSHNAKITRVTLLVALHVARIAGVVAFALAANVVMALLAFWLVGVVRTLQQPLYDARFARNAASETRATVISLRGLVNAFGQITGGPGIGVIGNRSLRVALLTVGLLLAPVLPLLWRIGRNEVPLAAEQPVTATPVL